MPLSSRLAASGVVANTRIPARLWAAVIRPQIAAAATRQPKSINATIIPHIRANRSVEDRGRAPTLG
ncbi:hypothetical protein [Kutzneria sp. CA-103260]|uniref:hypothetical protein n=1 Tax=Kutzneria sp. CA-103260 TaxID=2802641 RepID=UPI001BA4E3CA|nr:hypothetical protein [Kutzneria sp. CA-103260]QUQ66168.1 hypothetical protein JJ691_38940 [Kutzneria sp. CA-103260]